MKIKKLLTVVMGIVLITGMFTACGSSDSSGKESSSGETSVSEASKEADPYEGLTFYESDTGLSLYMEEGWTETSAEGVTCCYEGPGVGLSCREETFESLESVGISSDMTEAEYGKLLLDAYQLGDEVLTDEYGNVYICYEKEVMGQSVTYYGFIDKGTSSFWASSFMCLTEEKDSFEKDFQLWASSITIP